VLVKEMLLDFHLVMVLLLELKLVVMSVALKELPSVQKRVALKELQRVISLEVLLVLMLDPLSVVMWVEELDIQWGRMLGH